MNKTLASFARAQARLRAVLPNTTIHTYKAEVALRVYGRLSTHCLVAGKLVGRLEELDLEG